MRVVLYTTHCPRCSIIEKKLKAKGIEFLEVTSMDYMIGMGIKTVPMLRVDDSPLMNFTEANKWINSLEGKDG